jgi:hypothetical protein
MYYEKLIVIQKILWVIFVIQVEKVWWLYIPELKNE